MQVEDSLTCLEPKSRGAANVWQVHVHWYDYE